MNFEVVEDSKKDALELAQSCVGGLIESVDGYFDLPAGVHGWVNEEGLLMNLDPVMIFTYGGGGESDGLLETLFSRVLTKKDGSQA